MFSRHVFESEQLVVGFLVLVEMSLALERFGALVALEFLFTREKPQGLLQVEPVDYLVPLFMGSQGRLVHEPSVTCFALEWQRSVLGDGFNLRFFRYLIDEWDH